jgi:hypothetical protein
LRSHFSEASALEEQAAALPELVCPFVVTSTLAELPNVLAAEAVNVRFDYIIGRNVLRKNRYKTTAVQRLLNYAKIRCFRISGKRTASYATSLSLARVLTNGCRFVRTVW